jgi:hypothetical protein
MASFLEANPLAVTPAGGLREVATAPHVLCQYPPGRDAALPEAFTPGPGAQPCHPGPLCGKYPGGQFPSAWTYSIGKAKRIAANKNLFISIPEVGSPAPTLNSSILREINSLWRNGRVPSVRRKYVPRPGRTFPKNPGRRQAWRLTHARLIRSSRIARRGARPDLRIGRELPQHAVDETCRHWGAGNDQHRQDETEPPVWMAMVLMPSELSASALPS